MSSYATDDELRLATFERQYPSQSHLVHLDKDCEKLILSAVDYGSVISGQSLNEAGGPHKGTESVVRRLLKATSPLADARIKRAFAHPLIGVRVGAALAFSGTQGSARQM